MRVFYVSLPKNSNILWALRTEGTDLFTFIAIVDFIRVFKEKLQKK